MKHLITLSVIVIVLTGAIWAFFTFGGSQVQLSQNQHEILDMRDERFSQGDPNAPVTIVEYADVLCPYCARVHGELMPQIQAEYIDSGKVYYEMRLVGMIAPDSMRAAEGAYCAAEHGQFWSYMDTAYRDTWNNYYSINLEPNDIKIFSNGQISIFAQRAGITDSNEKSAWQQCMSDAKYRQAIEQNKSDMSEMKAYGTPHFIIDGKSYSGNPPYSILKTMIEAALNEQKTKQ